MSRKKEMGRGANGTGSIRKITSTRNGKEYTYWQARYTAGYDPGNRFSDLSRVKHKKKLPKS